MNKNLKYIFITLAVALVLGAVLAVLFLTEPQAADSAESSSESSSLDVSLISKDESSLRSFHVKNQYTEYDASVTASESSASESSDSSGSSSVTYTYHIDGYEDYMLKSSTLSSAVQNLYDLTSTKEIGEVEDLSEFGLEGDGEASLTANYSDGSTEELIIGNATATSSAARYVLYKGKVYTCSINTAFTSGVEYVMEPASWSVTTAADSETSTASSSDTTSTGLDSLPELSLRFKGGEDVDLSYDGEQDVYMLSSPVKIMAPDYYVEEFIATIKACSPTSVHKVKASADDLKACGLDDPEASLSFVLNGERHSCNVGSESSSGNRYITLEGDESSIYIIPEDSISWMDWDSLSLRGGLVYMRNIVDISALDITVDGKRADTQIIRTENDSSTEASKSYDYSVTVNGENKAYQGVTTAFYNSLISTAVLNMDKPEYSGDAAVSIKYSYWNGGSDTLEFFKSDSDRYAAVFNGEYVGTVRSVSIDTLRNDFRSFMDDESINEAESSESTESSTESSESLLLP